MTELQQFIQYNRENLRRSQNTLIAYQKRLERFIDHLGGKEPSEATIEQVEAFSRELAADKSPSTQRDYLVALKSIYKWLSGRGKNTVRPEQIVLPSVSDHKTRFLNLNEIKAVLKKAEEESPRSVALISLLFDTGLRLTELCGLEKEHIDFENNKLSVIGKGGKSRLVFFTPNTNTRLKVYLDTREDKLPFLFVACGLQGSINCISPRTVQRTVEAVVKKLGLKNVSVHTIRHSFATVMYHNGMDLRALQELMGHSNIQTTRRYTHVTNPQLQRQYHQYHPQA